MALPFHTLDVFTNKRFAGNPLAVVLDAGELNDRQMQSIAREFNLSETVFVLPPDDPANTAKVRIFMPNGELPFAGHPTIGTAVLLAGLGSSELSEIRLEERVGLVPVSIAVVNRNWHGTLASAVMPSPVDIAVDDNAMAAATGLRLEEIGFEGHQPGMFDAGVPYLFIPVRDLEALGNARVVEPHWSSMTAACGTDGAYIYTAGNGDVDWRARLYAPEAGIPEDPATGSAAAALPGQLSTAQQLADGRHTWTIGQGYEMGRPSIIELSTEIEKGDIRRVNVGGHAVKVSHGTINV